jgi:hypothetical protein
MLPMRAVILMAHAIQHRCQRKQSLALIVVLHPLGMLAKLLGTVAKSWFHS